MFCIRLFSSPVRAASRLDLIGLNSTAFGLSPGFADNDCLLPLFPNSFTEISIGISKCNGLVKMIVPRFSFEHKTWISATLTFPSLLSINLVTFAIFQRHLAVPSFLKTTKSPTFTHGSLSLIFWGSNLNLLNTRVSNVSSTAEADAYGVWHISLSFREY